METLILVLNNGDTLCASVEEKNGVYLCSDVLQILTRIDENGQGSMGIVDYLPFTDPSGGIAIPTNMAIVAVPSEELKNHYNSRFGKIITPTQKIIV